MPSRSSVLLRARLRPSRHARLLPWSAAIAGTALALAGCSPVVSVENADVPQWQATALPPAPAAVLEDAGKILNRDRIIREAADVPAGRYVLTATCEGGGKAFFAVSLNGKMLADAGAACNGSRETTKITLPDAGSLDISTYSVDAPLIYAYRLAPAE